MALYPPAFDEAEDVAPPLLAPKFEEAEDTTPPLSAPEFDEALDIPPERSPQGGLLARAGAAITEQTMQAGQGLLRGVEYLKPSFDFSVPKQFLRDVQERARGDYDVGTPTTFTQKAVEGAMSVPIALASGPGAPLAIGSMMAEQQAQEAEAAGGTEGQTKTAFAIGATVGAVTEKLMGIPALLRSAAKSEVPKLAMRIATQAAKSYGREGSQEWIEQVAGNLIASTFAGYDKDRETFEGAGEAFLLGGAIGAPVGAGIQAITPAPKVAPVQAASLKSLGANIGMGMESLVSPTQAPTVPTAAEKEANSDLPTVSVASLPESTIKTQQSVIATQGAKLDSTEPVMLKGKPFLQVTLDEGRGSTMYIPADATPEEIQTQIEVKKEEMAQPVPTVEEQISKAQRDYLPKAAQKLGLETVEPDTYQRIEDEAILPDHVAFKDPKTNQLFQIPDDATQADLVEILGAVRGEEAAVLKRAELEARTEEVTSRDAGEPPVAELPTSKPSGKYDPEFKPPDTKIRGEPVPETTSEPVTSPDLNLWNSPERLQEWLTRTQATTELLGKKADPRGPTKAQVAAKATVLARIAELERARTLATMKLGSKEKGSVKLDLLVDAGRTFYRKGMEFVEWSRNVLKGLGEKIKPYLRDIWKAVNQGPIRTQRQAQGGFTLNPFKGPSTSLTPEAYSKGEAARGMARWWLGQYGAFPKELRVLMERKNMLQKAIIENGESLGGNVLAEVKKLSRGSATTKERLMNEVGNVLEGGPAAIITDPDLLDATLQLRNYIDATSQAALSRGAVQGQTADIFRSNIGKWLKRYYAAFDPEANWNYDSLIKRAWKDGVKRTKVRDPKFVKIIRDAESFIRSSAPMTDVEVEGVLRGLTDRAQLESAFLSPSGGNKIKKSISSLLHRKNIDPAIRALMGEETNPVLRFSRSVNFMAQLLSKHEAQVAMRDFGLNTGLFSTTAEGRRSVEIVGPDSSTMDVLGGLYTSPEFKAAMEEADAHSSQMNNLAMQVFYRFGAETKMAKVPLNPDSWVTNALGGMFMNFANGTFFQNPDKTAKLFQDTFGIMNAGYGMTGAKRRSAATARFKDMRARLITEGVYDSSVALKDLEFATNAVAGDFLELGQVADRALGAARLGYYGKEFGEAIGGAPGAIAGGAAGMAAGAALGGKRVRKGLELFSSKVFGTPDNFWKITKFLDEFDTYQRAFPTKTPLEIARMAADITKNVMPTYAKIPQGLKSISRLGFINTFFQFNYEMFRNTGHTVALITKEAKSGNPVLQAKALKRVAGLSVVLGATSTALITKLSQSLSGMDDEEQEAFQRTFAPKWDRESPLFYTGRDENKVTYVNPQYMVPHTELTKIANAVMKGGEPNEIAQRVWNSYATDFFATGVHVGPAIEAFMNRKQSGAKIDAIKDTTGYLNRLDYVLDRTIRPGMIEKSRRVALAFKDESGEYGRVYTVDEQIKRTFGLRQNTYDMEKGLMFRFKEIGEAYRDAKASLTIAKNKGVSEEALEAQQKRVDLVLAAAEAKAKQTVEDAKTLGLTSTQIKNAQKASRIASDLRD